MNIKSILKFLKSNESAISMILGGIVIVIVGLIVVDYFRDVETEGTIPSGIEIENQTQNSLPTTHTVEAGESLWDISEEYYETGYNWVEIRDANNLANANSIEEGMELVIPNVETDETEDLAQASPSPTPQPTQEPTDSPQPTPTPQPQEDVDDSEQVEGVTDGDTYVVQRGDNLWDIAVEVYGDGFMWDEIAQANDLANPSIIHAGNVLTLPAR